MKHFIAMSLMVYVCGARNLIGRYFSAIGESQSIAQAEAIDKCQHHSLGCYPVGCHPMDELDNEDEDFSTEEVSLDEA